jgi:hypothetical protein
VEEERTKGRINLAQALKLSQLLGTTVDEERTKCRIGLAQALKLAQLSGTTVKVERTMGTGPQAVSSGRYHCGGGEVQV